MARVLALKSRAGIAALLGALALGAAGLPGRVSPAEAGSGCNKVAAPSGSDSAAGTEEAPYASVKKLVASLTPGQTACLRKGTYGGDYAHLRTPDTTLKSYPGERATITAFFEVYSSAPRARVTGLKFDGTNGSNHTAVKLNADDVVFSGNEVTKGGKGICVLAGSWYPAERIRIERNHIYNCGPSDTKFDHQLYLGKTRGAVIRWNILNGNGGGWGVHLYPNADGTLVEHNVIDDNRGGVIFAGDGGGDTADNNVVRNNSITYSGPRWNVEGSWSGGPEGRGNVAHSNCVHSAGPDSPSGIEDEEGFNSYSNKVLSGSPYVDRSRGDYRFRTDSPCATLVGEVAGVASGTTPMPAPGSSPTSPPAPSSRTSKPKPRRTRLVLSSRRKRVRPTGRVKLRGRVIGAFPARARLSLQVRSGRRWRNIARRRLSRSRFTVSLRTTSVRRRRIIRLRAVLPGVARSRVVRLRVAP